MQYSQEKALRSVDAYSPVSALFSGCPLFKL